MNTVNTRSETLIKNDLLVYCLVYICTLLLLAKDFLNSADRVVIVFIGRNILVWIIDGVN